MSTAEDIKNKIWAMANELRGNMDASEYRDYILGFMFYRFLSEHQLNWQSENEFPDLAGRKLEKINQRYAKEAIGDDLTEYLKDIADALGYAIEPKFTWISIVERVNDRSFAPSEFQEMFDKFANNAKLNPNAVNDFTGVFSDINLGNSRLGDSTNVRAKTLLDIVNLVNEIEYKDEAGHDILGDIYEYLIAEFAGNAGKKGGEFFTPHQVSLVLAKIIAANMDPEIEHPEVYDFACGSGSLLLTVEDELQIPGSQKRRKVRYYGQELNTTNYNMARMNLMMHGVDYQMMDLRNADTLENDWPDGIGNDNIDHPHFFDAVVANPPYSSRWDNSANKIKDARFKDYGLAPKTRADYAFLLHGLYHLNSRGTMAIVLPHGVLFRGNAEGKIRKALLEKNQIDAIIGLPAGLFFSTGIPTIIMVLKKNKTNKDVLFIDASGEDHYEKIKKQNFLREEDINLIIDTYKKREDVDKYAHVASIDEIKENDYNLNIPRYVDTFEEEPPIDLGELTQEISQTDQEIAESEQNLLSMMKELTSDDPKTMEDLKTLISLFEGEKGR